MGSRVEWAPVSQLVSPSWWVGDGRGVSDGREGGREMMMVQLVGGVGDCV